MSSEGTPKDEGQATDRLIAEARRARQLREQGYRARALKLLPWVCGKCGREFSGRKLRELTVHHKDHNHDNNPPDGSNWELLCMYCHDDEHSRNDAADRDLPHAEIAPTTHRPFAELDNLLKRRS